MLEQLVQLGLWFWLLAGIGIFLTGISKSGFGGGAGVMAVPLMAVAIDPKVAAAIVLPILVFIDMFNVKIYRQHSDGSLLKPALLGSLVGVIIGALSFQYLNGQIIKGIVGVVGIWFAVKNLFLARAAVVTAAQPGRLAAAGAMAGFTSFIAHAGGPPIHGYLLRLQLPKLLFLATSTIFFTVTNLIKIPAYALVDQFNVQVGLYSLVLLPVAAVGIYSGVKLKDYFSDKVFNTTMNWLLLLTSVYLLVDAFVW